MSGELRGIDYEVRRCLVVLKNMAWLMTATARRELNAAIVLLRRHIAKWYPDPEDGGFHCILQQVSRILMPASKAGLSAIYRQHMRSNCE